MEFVRLVEQTLLENEIKSLFEDVDEALKLVANGDEKIMGKAKKELLKDIDEKSVLRAFSLFKILSDKLDSKPEIKDPNSDQAKEILSKRKRLEVFKEWLKDFFNKHEGEIESDQAKELLIKLKKEKGFKGNVLAIN
jgi:hypothetical protein